MRRRLSDIITVYKSHHAAPSLDCFSISDGVPAARLSPRHATPRPSLTCSVSRCPKELVLITSCGFHETGCRVRRDVEARGGAARGGRQGKDMEGEAYLGVARAAEGGARALESSKRVAVAARSSLERCETSFEKKKQQE